MKNAQNCNTEPAKRNRPLIVSYSYSGNTHQIARALQAITGGDWVEIHARQPYPMAFPALLAQVKQEIRSGYFPQLLPAAGSVRLYRVVVVGSPVWCGTIAPPLASWLRRNDLAGKILLPFYSHCGGTVGDFRGDIARLCPKADVRKALGVMEDGGEDLAERLRAWLAEAGAG